MSEARPRHTLSQPTLARAANLRDYLAGYFWAIFKNVIGWVLILASFPVGLAIPGPFGMPLFIVGFALIAFPGKRKLTSRVMRGRGFDLEARIFTILTTFVAVLATALILWLAIRAYNNFLSANTLEQDIAGDWIIEPVTWVGVGLIALGITWGITRLSLRLANWLITIVPKIRRTFRPWLERRGLKLLPSRRKRVMTPEGEMITPNEEILEINPHHVRQARRIWRASVPWLKRLLTIGITSAIFYFMLSPLVNQWHALSPRLAELSWARFSLGVIMFAGFLLLFRATTWRGILSGLGHRIPFWPTLRIWSTSELARYLPGVIWQVVGRVWLAKPYGVRGSVVGASQILELVLFLLANLIVAVVCLSYFGHRQLDGAARGWLIAAGLLLPLLLVAIHPRVFKILSGQILTLFRKPVLERELSTGLMFGLLLLSVVGLLWQSLALWTTLGQPLGLGIDKWWILAGAYCLAWCAGFLAVWAPGGLGVRELVFMLALSATLPADIRNSFADDESRRAFLAFLAVLLRVWVTAGEFLVTALAYSMDWRGARGDPDAPGRVTGGATPLTTVRFDPS